MENIINELVREFYLGDGNAWRTLMDLMSNRMQGRLNRDFSNLPDGERYDLLSKFEVKFYMRVKLGQEEAERQIQNSPRELTVDEITALKIQHCTANARFDLSLGKSFEKWMWACLVNLALSELERLKLRPEFVDIDNASETFHALFKNQPEQGELKDRNAIKKMLKPVLEGDELIYLEVWFNHGPDPKAHLVKDAIAKERGKNVGDVYISNLKQNFLMKSYLELLERSDKINSLTHLFQRLMKISEIQEEMFVVMMDNIWKAFYEDDKAIHKSKTEISAALWAKWRTLTLRRGVQEKILVEAYHHFRLSRPPLHFCYKIELYSDNRFGSNVRKLFMEGGAKN